MLQTSYQRYSCYWFQMSQRTMILHTQNIHFNSYLQEILCLKGGKCHQLIETVLEEVQLRWQPYHRKAGNRTCPVIALCVNNNCKTEIASAKAKKLCHWPPSSETDIIASSYPTIIMSGDGNSLTWMVWLVKNTSFSSSVREVSPIDSVTVLLVYVWTSTVKEAFYWNNTSVQELWQSNQLN